MFEKHLKQNVEGGIILSSKSVVKPRNEKFHTTCLGNSTRGSVLDLFQNMQKISLIGTVSNLGNVPLGFQVKVEGNDLLVFWAHVAIEFGPMLY